jgi:recombination protein RecT
MTEQQQQLTKKEEPISVRFTNRVIAEFTGGVGEVALSDFQRRLAQNYFIAADAALKNAEAARLRKPEKYRDPVPVTWANVNMESVAQAVVSAARIGLDPMQRNHVSLIPFKNNHTGKYELAFIEGYRGLELKAEKYALDMPTAVVVELVYANDHFRVIKGDYRNPGDGYEFEIKNPFDRGELLGGFYFHYYENNPRKNKLVVMPLKEILKRKPAHAAPEFWGGEKDIWENGKKVGTQKIEGWFEKMCWKTVFRAAYNDLTIDSEKIDADYRRLKQLEQDYEASAVAAEIAANANREPIDIDAHVVSETGPTDEPMEEAPQAGQSEPEKTRRSEPVQSDLFASEAEPVGAAADGPGF